MTDRSKKIINVQLQGLLELFFVRQIRKKRNLIYNEFHQNMPKVIFHFQNEQWGTPQFVKRLPTWKFSVVFTQICLKRLLYLK